MTVTRVRYAPLKVVVALLKFWLRAPEPVKRSVV